MTHFLKCATVSSITPSPLKLNSICYPSNLHKPCYHSSTSSLHSSQLFGQKRVHVMRSCAWSQTPGHSPQALHTSRYWKFPLPYYLSKYPPSAPKRVGNVPRLGVESVVTAVAVEVASIFLCELLHRNVTIQHLPRIHKLPCVQPCHRVLVHPRSQPYFVARSYM